MVNAYLYNLTRNGGDSWPLILRTWCTVVEWVIIFGGFCWNIWPEMWATEGGCTWKFVCTTACENDFKRVFTLYALANCSLRLMWFVVDVEASAYSAGHVFSWIGRARRQTSLSKETNKCHTHRNWSCMLSLLATLTSSKTIYVCNDSLMARGWGNNSSSCLVPPKPPKTLHLYMPKTVSLCRRTHME